MHSEKKRVQKVPVTNSKDTEKLVIKLIKKSYLTKNKLT